MRFFTIMLQRKADLNIHIGFDQKQFDRVMDFLEGTNQKKIAELTARLESKRDELGDAISAVPEPTA